MKTIDFLLADTLSQIELLAQQTNAVLWVRDSNYNKQLFVSNTYEAIWQRKCIELYQEATIWESYLALEHQKEIRELLKARNTEINPNHIENYCFCLPNGEKQWCIDSSFRINDAQMNCLIIAGVAMPISEEALLENRNAEIIKNLDSVAIRFYKLLTQGVIPQSYSEFYRAIKTLTPREWEVLKGVFYGLPSKKIAIDMGISPRTVEAHFENIKKKLGCTSRSELISTAIENNCIYIILPENIINEN